MGNGLRWLVVAGVVALAVWGFIANPLHLGIDIQGGTRITYAVPSAAILELVDEDRRPDAVMDRVVEVIALRIDGLGLRQLTVQREGARHLVIGAPRMTEEEREEIKRRMVHLGRLEFLIGIGSLQGRPVMEVAVPRPGGDALEAFTFDEASAEARRLAAIADERDVDGGARPDRPWTLTHADDGRELPIVWHPYRAGQAPAGRGEGAWLYRDPEFFGAGQLGFSGKDIADVKAVHDPHGRRVVSYEVRPVRRADFEDYTRRYVRRPMAIVLNDELWSAPVIEQPLFDSVQIRGGGAGFDEAEQRWLVDCLDSGSLEVRPEFIGQEEVSPTVGAVPVQRSIAASIIGLALIAAFMIGWYRLGGGLALIGLACNLVLVAGALALFEATITLPGLAGILLTIGMAVDANILIFERIREELAKGKMLKAAVSAGYDRAFVTIVDANLTTLLAGAVLYGFGVGPIRGFGVTLMTGIACSLFSALFVTRTAFRTLISAGWLTTLRLGSLLRTTLRFRWMARPRLVAAMCIVVLVASVATFIGVGDAKYGLDFTGGLSTRLHFTEPLSLVEVTEALRDVRTDSGAPAFRDISPMGLQAHADASGTRFEEGVVRLQPDTDPESVEVSGIRPLIAGAFGDRLDEVRGLSHAGPSVVTDLKQRAVVSFVFCLLGLIAYIWLRFRRLSFGVAAAVATVHDVVVAASVVVAAHWLGIVHAPFDLAIIAGFLTILGYSLNDTIVLFDRIRENTGHIEGSFRDIVEKSINQTLSRTLLTSLTTFAVVAVMLILNRGQRSSIEGLAFTLLVGVTVGTLSSLFVAAPVLVRLERSQGR
ncbi:MAG: hypothetical protein CMJ83_10845 [Planctomycetes bacterium]|nr:hypothetical protein [Planctomycetota bacterium]